MKKVVKLTIIFMLMLCISVMFFACNKNTVPNKNDTDIQDPATDTPGDPSQPEPPSEPDDPTDPVTPSEPAEPTKPDTPTNPTETEHVHNFDIKINAKQPTCTEDGNIAYYYCEGCKKKLDKDGNELTSVVLKARGHSYGEWIEEVSKTCTEDGKKGCYYCTGCLTYFDNQHNIIEDITIPASHEFDGDICSVCGAKRTTLNLSYQLSGLGDYYTLTGMGTATDTVIIIPETYNKKPIKKIGTGAFSGCNNIEKVVIPEGITDIGGNAFYGCTKLTEITLPVTVTQIEGYSFRGCTALNAVYYLGTADSWCGIDFATKEANPLYYAGNLYIDDELTEELALTTATAINDYQFYGWNGFKITLPEGMSYIGNEAFKGCNKLIEVRNLSDLSITKGSTGQGYIAYYALNVYSDDVDEKIQTIDGYKIYTDGEEEILVGYTGKATALVLPENLTAIYKYAFDNNGSIQSVVIPENVREIGVYAFDRCTALREITFLSTNCADLAYDNHVFSDVGRNTVGVTVYIGANVNTVPAYLFSPDSKGETVPRIKEVYFDVSGTCKTIGANAFKYCTELETAELREGLTEIAEAAFYGCTSLKTTKAGEEVVELPSTLEKIGGWTFYGCVSIKEAVIHTKENTYQTIGSSIFAGCASMYNLTLPFVGNRTGVTEHDNYQYPLGYVFGDSSYDGGVATKQLYVANTDEEMVTKIYYIPQTLSSVKIAGGEILAGAFSNCSELQNITMPDEATKIGKYAFLNCRKVYYFDIADGVTDIDAYAFYGCSGLTEINISKNVTTINTTAFADCGGMTTLTVEEDNPIYHSAGNCLIRTAAKILVAGCVNAIIPNDGSVEIISERAFDGRSGMTAITIPSHITRIDKYAFNNTVQLSHVTFLATNCADLTRECNAFRNAGIYISGITVTIGANVTRIPAYLFAPEEGSPNINSITFEDNCILSEISDGAFKDCVSLTGLYIPMSVDNISESAFVNCNVAEIIVAAENPKYVGVNNCIIDKTTKTLVFGCGNSIIPDDGNVTDIAEYAFAGCTDMTAITIPETITRIGSHAFTGCSELSAVNYNAIECADIAEDNQIWKDAGTKGFNVVVGTRVNVIPKNLFRSAKVSALDILNGLTKIGDYAFAYTDALMAISLPNSVTEVGEGAFMGSGASSLALGEGLTVMGRFAFADMIFLNEINYSAVNCGDLTNDNGAFRSAGQAVSYGISFYASDAVDYIPAFLMCPNENNYSPKITRLIIANSVITIGKKAFAYCSNFTELSIPNSVTAIGEGAFYSCTSIENLGLGEKAANLGKEAFYNCVNLTKIEYNVAQGEDLTEENGVFAYAGQNSDGIYVSTGTRVEHIPENLFRPTTDGTATPKVIEVVIGKNVVNIGCYAFAECGYIKEVYYNAVICDDTDGNVFLNAGSINKDIILTVGASVTKIPARIFQDATIKALNFSVDSNCTLIGNSAFRDCIYLKTITIPNKVVTIEDNAFYNCTALETMYFNAIECSDFAENNGVFFRAGLECNGLNLIIGAKVKYLPSAIFYPDVGDSDQENLNAPKVVAVSFASGGLCAEIHDAAFCQVESLQNFHTPDTLTKIGEKAFYGCMGLTYFDVTANITEIGSEAFKYCYRIVEITNKSILNIEVKSTNHGEIAYYALKIYEDEFQSRIVTDESGCVLYMGEEDTFFVNYIGVGREIVIPDNVTVIDEHALYRREDITTVTIPNGVREIGNFAFAYSGITAIELPDSVTELGDSVFECSAIEQVQIGNGVTHLPDRMLYNCENFYSINAPGTTSIGNYSFYGCISMTSFTIREGITWVGDYAFAGCSSMISFVISSSVTHLGVGIVANCPSLANIDVSIQHEYYSNFDSNMVGNTQTGVLEIGCKTGLIPDDGRITEIAPYAFISCVGLVGIVIPTAITTIGGGAFYDCNDLTAIYYTGTQNQWNEITKVSSDFDGITVYYYDESLAGDNTWRYDVDNNIETK